MAISGILSALIIGIVVGALGRLVVPGKQKIAIWLTILVGIIAAFVGTWIAALLSVAVTPGLDWIEFAIQVALAAGAVAALSSGFSRSAKSSVRKRS